jgi:hypothetical protein
LCFGPKNVPDFLTEHRAGVTGDPFPYLVQKVSIQVCRLQLCFGPKNVPDFFTEHRAGVTGDPFPYLVQKVSIQVCRLQLCFGPKNVPDFFTEHRAGVTGDPCPYRVQKLSPCLLPPAESSRQPLPHPPLDLFHPKKNHILFCDDS